MKLKIRISGDFTFCIKDNKEEKVREKILFI